MKHLFIINPTAGKISGRLNAIENDIRSFFAGNPGLDYTIHFTRWKRDASGYTLRYVNDTPEIVRVYAFGGNGTFFEVINGAVGLPNVQIAWYPLGRNNSLLYSFGAESLSAFQSLRNLSLSPVSTIDTIKAGNNYMAINALIGSEAAAFRWGESLADHFALPRNACYIGAGIINAFLHRQSQHYYFETEDTQFHGDFRSILVTNTPTYGAGLRPAVEALMDDGYMDLYTIRRIPRRRIITVIGDYTRGNYRKWPEYISHYRCKKLKVFSDSIMTISIDGEFFYRTSLDFEICPGSLDFVCPPEITIPRQKEGGLPGLSRSSETEIQEARE